MSVASASLHHSISVHFGISGSEYRKTRPNRSRPPLLLEDWTTATLSSTGHRSPIYKSCTVYKILSLEPLLVFVEVNTLRPVLAKMHWQYCIQFKLALLTFKVMTTPTPDYFTKLVRRYKPSRQLQSCGKNLLEQNRSEERRV